MKHLSFILSTIVLTSTACSVLPVEEPRNVAPEIVASMEFDSSTKTLLSVDSEGVGTIYWKPTENINVFYGTTSVQYTSKNTENVTVASFKTTEIVGSTEEASTNIWGLYPYNEEAVCNGSKVTTTIPSNQYGIPETFDDNLFTTLAHSTTRELKFYNVCGGIKFSLSRADITKITFEGNNGETLAGKVDLAFTDAVPVATPVKAESKITLTPKTGTTFAKDVNYYIVTLPVSMSGGFTMTFETETQIGTFNYTTKSVNVARSKFSKKDNIDTYATFVNKGIQEPISSNEYIIYHPNYHNYSTSTRYYSYYSHVEAPSGPTWEIKLQLPSGDNSYYGFCSTNTERDTYCILEVSTNGYYYRSSGENVVYASVSYSALSPAVDGTNPVVLFLSGSGCYVNGVNTGASFDGLSGFSMFTPYGYDDGSVGYGGGLPDGTKIYYVKVWDSDGNLSYVGHPGKESNSDEWGWRSVTINQEKYEYARTGINKPDGVTIIPYGHGFD